MLIELRKVINEMKNNKIKPKNIDEFITTTVATADFYNAVGQRIVSKLIKPPDGDW